jgi:hypothetical protein
VGLVALLIAFAGIIYLISRIGGWHSLALRYRRPPGPRPNTKFWMASMGIGPLIGYHGCVMIGANERGLYLSVWPLFRFGHAPLLIPWSALKPDLARRFLWVTTRRYNVDGGPVLQFAGGKVVKFIDGQFANWQQRRTTTGATA